MTESPSPELQKLREMFERVVRLWSSANQRHHEIADKVKGSSLNAEELDALKAEFREIKKALEVLSSEREQIESELEKYRTENTN